MNEPFAVALKSSGFCLQVAFLSFILIVLSACEDNPDYTNNFPVESERTWVEYQDCYDCPQMMVIPEGEFMMGDFGGSVDSILGMFGGMFDILEKPPARCQLPV